MIHGIGVDIVQVERIERWLGQPGLVDRFFNSDELEALMHAPKQVAQSLAARFAAKEAFAKALGTGLRGLELRSIWIASDGRGKPCLNCSGAARQALERLRATGVHVSLSHERAYAVAMVVIEVPDV